HSPSSPLPRWRHVSGDEVVMGGRFRVRRLTLAPRGLDPEDVDECVRAEADRILGREKLAREVEITAACFSNPGPHVHGIEEDVEIIREEENEEIESLGTPEFIRRAGEAGFSPGQLLAAEEEMVKPSYLSLGEHSMAKQIIDGMTAKARETSGKPWKGPLPPPRQSPPMTLGAALNKASVLFRGTHWLRFWGQMQQHEEDKNSIKTAPQHLESLAMQIFAHNGWRFSNRIGYT
ncbi:unnamed protein product, partial [Urochloa humidicola]